MMELEFLQNYWWLLISVLGALLVFMLFVQGGQSMLFCSKNDDHRTLMVNSLGRKWELTYTMLVVFGGAFFASFPLFYSTSFGGAYWLWMLILISFVVQAVSYEFRRKKGNLYGTGTYDGFLLFNGLFGCVLLGVVVGTMFFGGEFVVTKGNIVDGQSPVISTWADTHGLEAIFNWRNLLLGFVVFFLARTQALLYFINNIERARHLGVVTRNSVIINGGIFAVLFIAFVVVLLTTSGLRATSNGFECVDNIYMINMLEMWWTIPIFLLGVVFVLYAIIRTIFSSYFRKGIWWSGVGTILVVLVLFWLAGYNDTAYYPSTVDAASSLTIRNSSSSEFTLTVMSWVSVLVPFVVAYIVYVWYKMDFVQISIDELNKTSHKY
jgi:cytochrome d ubiquinol oxidase subunit II